MEQLFINDKRICREEQNIIDLPLWLQHDYSIERRLVQEAFDWENVGSSGGFEYFGRKRGGRRRRNELNIIDHRKDVKRRELSLVPTYRFFGSIGIILERRRRRGRIEWRRHGNMESLATGYGGSTVSCKGIVDGFTGIGDSGGNSGGSKFELLGLVGCGRRGRKRG